MILRNIMNKTLSPDIDWTRQDAAGRGTDAGKRRNFLGMNTRQIFVKYVRPLDASSDPGMREGGSAGAFITPKGQTLFRGHLLHRTQAFNTPNVVCGPSNALNAIKTRIQPNCVFLYVYT